LELPRNIFMAATVIITLVTGYDYFSKAVRK